jgi:hypothetical protein
MTLAPAEAVKNIKTDAEKAQNFNIVKMVKM